jgi:Ca2+-binding EF-hand superfamily protein
MTLSVTHDVYTRKMKHVFEMLDVTKDGFLAEDDFAELAAGIAKLMPGAQNQRKIRDFHDAMVGWWRGLLPVMKKNRDGKVGPREFCDAMHNVMIDQDRFEVFRPVAVTWFHLYDADDSNSLSLDEFQTLSKTLQISESDTAAGFRKFDANGDGELSEDEFITVARQFYAGEDPDAPGNWLYGPV